MSRAVSSQCWLIAMREPGVAAMTVNELLLLQDRPHAPRDNPGRRGDVICAPWRWRQSRESGQRTGQVTGQTRNM